MNSRLDFNNLLQPSCNYSLDQKLTHFPTPSPENNYLSDISEESFTELSLNKPLNNLQDISNYTSVLQDFNCYPTPPKVHNPNPVHTQNINQYTVKHPQCFNNVDNFKDPAVLNQEVEIFNNWMTRNPEILEMVQNGYKFANVDGMTSGIPTRTTPTLTPTTLKNIEETIFDIPPIPPPPLEHQHQAGFVPPVVNISGSSLMGQNGNTNYQLSQKDDDNDGWLSPCVQATLANTVRHTVNTSSNAMTPSSKPSGRNQGGRKPMKDEKLSPEEEERRRLRRERNKLAAARCRKRRMDHTNNLLMETEGLEEKRQALQNEIQLLTSQKEELEFILEAHKTTCKISSSHPNQKRSTNGAILSNGKNTIVALSNGSDGTSKIHMKPLNRPTSLPVSSAFTNPDGSSSLKISTTNFNDVTGIPISTPSGGIFNYESLMEGGTGLTPVSSGLTPIISSCAGQQRSSSSDLSSPDTINPPKLVSL